MRECAKKIVYHPQLGREATSGKLLVMLMDGIVLSLRSIQPYLQPSLCLKELEDEKGGRGERDTEKGSDLPLNTAVRVEERVERRAVAVDLLELEGEES